MLKLCGAHRRQGEGTCRKTAGWGTSTPGVGYCRLHGGSTPTQVKRAREVAVEKRVRVELARLDVAAVDDPLAELRALGPPDPRQVENRQKAATGMPSRRALGLP